MRVYNLTDVATPTLEQRGLVGQHIALSGRMIAPGEYADVEETTLSRADASDLVKVGALSIDQLPPPYVLGRQQLAATTGKLAAQVGQRIDMKETKVAGEGFPGPPAEGEKVTPPLRDPMAEASDPPPPAPPVPEDPPPNQPPPPQPAQKPKKNR